MKKYIVFFRMRLMMGLQYRTAAIAGMTTQFAWGFMQIMIYRAFYEADRAAFPMEFSAVVSYIWLQQALLTLLAVWMMESEIFESITNGGIAYELCRPVRIYNMWFARTLANRISKAMLRFFPVLFVAVIVPKPYGLSAPASAFHLAAFLVTLLLGLFVTVALGLLVYTLTFFTISPQGIRIVFTAMADFLSGGIILLPFFPEKLQRILELLPFAAIQNVPLMTYSGSLSAAGLQRAVCLQVAWLVILVVLGSRLCRYAEKRTAVQGG